jgi:competence protein ComFA
LNSFSPELQHHLSGRFLLQSEIPFSEKELDQHIAQGFVSEKPGIIPFKKSWKCSRCSNTNPQLFAAFPCARCGGKLCTYCRNCIMMGRVSSCTPLFTWTGPEPAISCGHHPLQWEGALSEGQLHASSQVVQAIRTKTTLLIWAVCGAGKTEVLFAGINKALEKGLRVCIATPRTDVVLELAPRFRKVFPGIPVAALYGGSEDRHLFAPLTIATTHQLYRFEDAFDVVIVDEVDAFPFTMDQTLQAAVEKAAKPHSARCFLTATPNRKWQQECRTGRLSFVTIPARFHRYPLPVPECTWCGNWKKHFEKKRLPSGIVKWVEIRIQAGKQVLIFLPNIKLMQKAMPIFQAIGDVTMDSVHAGDPDRKAKVEKMRSKETQILLTTTILERGVTFPNIDVAVIGAEDPIFTEAALVQIAGRVGRSADFPAGTITFFHYGKTSAILKSIRHITSMNTQAKKRGLIHG